DPAEAPSNLAVVGRYILTERIFRLLDKVQPGADGEIQLTDAIEALMGEQTVLAYEFSGTRYDCGSKFGYLKANVEVALQHPEVGAEFRDYLKALTASWDKDESARCGLPLSKRLWGLARSVIGLSRPGVGYRYGFANFLHRVGLDRGQAIVMKSELNDRFIRNSPLFGGNSGYLEAYYEQYLSDPESVEPGWR